MSPPMGVSAQDLDATGTESIGTWQVQDAPKPTDLKIQIKAKEEEDIFSDADTEVLYKDDRKLADYSEIPWSPMSPASQPKTPRVPIDPRVLAFAKQTRLAYETKDLEESKVSSTHESLGIKKEKKKSKKKKTLLSRMFFCSSKNHPNLASPPVGQQSPLGAAETVDFDAARRLSHIEVEESGHDEPTNAQRKLSDVPGLSETPREAQPWTPTLAVRSPSGDSMIEPLTVRMNDQLETTRINDSPISSLSGAVEQEEEFNRLYEEYMMVKNATFAEKKTVRNVLFEDLIAQAIESNVMTEDWKDFVRANLNQ